MGPVVAVVEMGSLEWVAGAEGGGGLEFWGEEWVVSVLILVSVV